MKQKAVVLVSGGLDSATCLALAMKLNYDCYALSFDYGQKSRSELIAASKVTSALQAKQHKTISLSLGELGGSALTDTNIEVPDFCGDNKIPVTYVPARNTVFLSIALGWAEVIDAKAIFIGVSAVDYSGYPDCRPEYIDAFQTMANLATKAGVEGHPIKIFSPLINLSKAETIKTGKALGLDYSLTVTCYQADTDGRACGNCDSCELRRRGFEEAGISDPTRYVSETTCA
jgi:7-cyano-7-deazaguanine synthase